MLCRWILLLLAATPLLNAAEAQIHKVLPHLLDKQGRHTLSPSLYERDAYQVHLRERPEEISALRFDVHWKAPKTARPYKLRLELRGSKTDIAVPRVFEVEASRGGFFSRWTALRLSKENYEELGRIIAWRVTLWDGGLIVAEQESFLW
jgi:hypothetical protein